MENQIITPQGEAESTIVEKDDCAFSSSGTIKKVIGKTTYLANLHFKEQGQTFKQKLKRVLKSES